jgi:hypothetical protein
VSEAFAKGLAGESIGHTGIGDYILSIEIFTEGFRLMKGKDLTPPSPFKKCLMIIC